MSTGKTASVAFEDSWLQESVALFVSNDGEELVKAAQRFCENLANLKTIDVGSLSSNEAMFKFCMWLANPPYIEELKGDEESRERYYFGTNGEDGDNRHLGHHVINILSAKVVRQVIP
jgi:hypothetical protein